jgi:hypothetical protein
MKMKLKNIFKITALFLCLAMILPLAAACGAEDNPPAAGSNENDSEAIEETNEPEPETEAETTPPPETEPPTTTEPEPELPPIDPSLPYYEYLDEEFSRFGFVDGDRIVAETEAEVMAALRGVSVVKTEIDLSGQDVPFEHAVSFDVTRIADNFWDIAVHSVFNSDKTLTQGDIIAGVVYMRDAGGANPAQAHFAIKTPTNDWSGEGNMNITVVEAEETWKKVYFHAESAADETRASTAYFALFLGFDPQTIEIGGIYINRYPATSENIRATGKMPYSW